MSESSADAIDFDHGDPELVQDPYPVYQRLRDECPVGHGSKYGGFWVYSRYEDVLAAELEPAIYSSGAGVTIPLLAGGLPAIPLQTDPPEHRDFRALLQPLFTRTAVAKYEARIRQIARDCISGFRDRGHADLTAELAVPLPPLVIAELFGLPPADCEYFRGLAQAIVGGADSDAGRAAGLELVSYLGAQIAARTDDPRDDLATHIAHAALPHRTISDEEKLGIAQLMVVAGHETTVASIASMLALVGSVPGLQQLLIDSPGLIPAAVEESLRLEAPVQNFARTLKCPVERHGVSLAAGDRVMIVYGAANRDERRFAAPDTFDLERRPNSHLSFGAGIHRCLGAPLGQLEMRVVLEEVLSAIPGYRVERADVTVRGMIAREFTSVPATWPVSNDDSAPDDVALAAVSANPGSAA